MESPEKAVLDELKMAAIDCVIYFQNCCKPMTKKQMAKLDRLKQALYAM